MQLLKDSRVAIIAMFNSAVDKSTFSAEELERHELFEPYFGRWGPSGHTKSPENEVDRSIEAGTENKRLFLHFGTKVDKVEVPLANGNKRMTVTDHEGKQYAFRASDIITAMGFKPPQTSWVDKAVNDIPDGVHKPYVLKCGWASGAGGNLGKVKKSVKEAADQIQSALRAGKFNNGAEWYPNRRLPLRGHLAQAEANTLRYLLGGNRIYTRDDHAMAQQHVSWQRVPEADEEAADVAAAEPEAPRPEAAAIDKNTVMVDETPLTDFKATDKAHTVMVAEELMAPVECDGDGVCLKCLCTVTGDIEHNQEEKAILSANGFKPNNADGSHHVLSCFHDIDSFAGKRVIPKYK